MVKPPRTLNVSLTPDLSEFIAVRVASGRYQSASEVVRAGLRLMERDETGWTSPKGTHRASGRESTGAGEQRG
jgi:antitoxin ParD1/3/4